MTQARQVFDGGQLVAGFMMALLGTATLATLVALIAAEMLPESAILLMSLMAIGAIIGVSVA